MFQQSFEFCFSLVFFFSQLLNYTGSIFFSFFFFPWCSDEYRIKPVEEVKYMKNGGEDDQKIAARNQENLVRIELIAYLMK